TQAEFRIGLARHRAPPASGIARAEASFVAASAIRRHQAARSSARARARESSSDCAGLTWLGLSVAPHVSSSLGGLLAKFKPANAGCSWVETKDGLKNACIMLTTSFPSTWR